MISSYLLIGVIVVQAFGHILIARLHAHRFQRTIDRQNDTIQRLIQREPVTYAEVGQTPPKKSKEVFAAWGSQMVNIDEDDVQLK